MSSRSGRSAINVQHNRWWRCCCSVEGPFHRPINCPSLDERSTIIKIDLIDDQFGFLFVYVCRLLQFTSQSQQPHKYISPPTNLYNMCIYSPSPFRWYQSSGNVAHIKSPSAVSWKLANKQMMRFSMCSHLVSHAFIQSDNETRRQRRLLRWYSIPWWYRTNASLLRSICTCCFLNWWAKVNAGIFIASTIIHIV